MEKENNNDQSDNRLSDREVHIEEDKGRKQPTTQEESAQELESEKKIEEKARPGPITTYRMRPSLKDLFRCSQVKELIQSVLTNKLLGKVYNADDAGKWTREIADEVSAAVKDQLNMPRYKHVVQVTLGQQLGAGCCYIAKCCWDAEADSQTSDIFTSASLFCVCTVFGVYLY